VWAEEGVTIYDSNQGPSANAEKIGQLFDLEPDKVRVVSEHVGGGFGSKGSPRVNIVLATMAAKVTGRPVQLVLTRQELFSLVGYRTPTLQRIQLGATRDGVLTAITHDVVEQTSQLYEFAEQTAVSTRHMYAADNRRTAHQLARLDMPTPRWMRAPGECPGMYALESAMDELAQELGIDPIELRVRNEPEVEPESGTPFTSRHYVDCLRAGAERFGWDSRDPRPGVRRDGEWLVGTGVAGAMYPVNIMPSKARVTAHANGRFTVALGAVDIGTGARTAIGQITADELGVDDSLVDVQLGDSSLPHASIAGGSSGTSSWGWAISLACKGLKVDLQRHRGVPPAAGISAIGDASVDVSEVDKEGKHAFGAHFAEVRVSTVTGEVRMSRMLGVYAAGRIVNPRTARSQFIGGMVMGIGMALHEEGVLDPAFGNYVNHDLAEYHIPANADITDIEAYWLPEDDDSLNPTRTKGIGEIGIVGVAAAVANAVWHATGIRVRDLPIHLEDLLR
jgi:xanthine dehydrogenase YagR molybdenum-binding subunit